MKNFFKLVISFFLIGYSAHAQNFIIKGRVKCENTGPNSTRGAANIIVVPGFDPEKSTFTESQDRAGFFRINLGPVYKDLRDKKIALYVVSRCENCSENQRNQLTQYRDIFIDQRLDKETDEDFSMTLKKDWKIPKKCTDVELLRSQQDAWLRQIQQQESVKIKENKGTVLMGAPGLLGLLAKLVTVATFQNFGFFKPIELKPGKIIYGNQQRSLPMVHSLNTGFNFSPVRNLSEAVFWNSSATAFNDQKTNISLISNARNNLKLSGHFGIKSRLTIGAGVVYSRQDEFRPAIYEQITSGNKLPESSSDSIKMKLDEFGIYLTSAFRVSPKLGVGISLKSLHQNLTIPTLLQVDTDENGDNINIYTDSLIKKQTFNFDISATYQITHYLQLGINVMNILESQLYADAFVPEEKNRRLRDQRSLGIGLTYRWWRFNLGSDVLLTEKRLYDASVGLNFVPFNNALISGGYTVKQKSFSASFKIRHFCFGYIDDHKLMINEIRKPISPIFNGRIYSGFSFNF